MPRPTATAAWRQLDALAKQDGGQACSTHSAEAAGIFADFSRQQMNADVLAALVALAREQGLEAKREAMFSGVAINASEKRPVLHTALRGEAAVMVDGVDVHPGIAAELEKMRRFSDGVRSGRLRSVSERAFTDVVAIGIGGSALGPELVCQALAAVDGPRLHFVSNVDGAALVDALHHLDAATTLFLVTSKTFTTDETLTNAQSAAAWIATRLGADAVARHMVAITANPAEAIKRGYAIDRIFEFWPWVGGRFSLWSSVGLPIALAAGYEPFARFLDGARAMDEHFRNAPLAGNLPVLLALTGIWNRNFHGVGAHAVLPYASRLALLPRYLQQAEMESNGKSVDLDGQPLDYATCPVLFGEPGTDGQHSFHQLLHQGTDPISADIILVAKAPSKLPGHHAKLLANGIAQADALWLGRATEDRQRHHAGGRPVTLLVLPELDAFHLGALIALYEHKVFTQGVIWHINSFDQWGVELGKTLATGLAASMDERAAPAPEHLVALIARLREMARTR